MNTDNVSVSCVQLSKSYHLRSIDNNTQINNALEDISFKLRKGEAFGIIGANGSGKTTLLKILSGIIKPTSGSIVLQGKVSSVIDIGSEFNPELTGRENIIMSAKIQFRNDTQEIKTITDSVIEFSEIGKYIDEPLKNYSMGMYLRLALSMSLYYTPDILIIDEVLSAGDAYFINKFFPLLNKIVNTGTTLIFASHNLHDIRAMTTKCMWLEGGKVKTIGTSSEVVSIYQHQQENAAMLLMAKENEHGFVHEYKSKSEESKLSWCASILSCTNCTMPNRAIDYSEKFSIRLLVSSENVLAVKGITLYVTDMQNQTILTTSPDLFDPYKDVKTDKEINSAFTCIIPAHFLNVGNYLVHISLYDKQNNVIEQGKRVLRFSIRCDNQEMYKILEKIPVRVTPNLHWVVG